MTEYKRLAALVVAAALTACTQTADEAEAVASDAETSVAAAPECPTADAAGVIDIAPGLSAKIITSGDGRAAVNGDYADTNVWLWQLDDTAEDRRGQFVWESGQDIFQFQLGGGEVIKGWDLGVPCMRVGETRELVVSSELAYGSSGRGAAIPPNTALIFTIELVKLTASE